MAKATVVEVEKANDTKLVGLTIREEGSKVAPTFYLDGAYSAFVLPEAFRATIEEVATGVVDTYRQQRDVAVDLNNLFSFDNLIENVRVKLLALSSNKEYLKDKVFRVVADLAEVLYLKVDMGGSDSGEASVVLTTQHLSELDDSQIDELFSAAEANIEEAAEVINMTDMLAAMAPEMDVEEGPVGMYVVTNRSRTNGASAILCTSVREDLIEKLGTDKIFILPSSIHEVIAVPQDTAGAGELLAMVKEVNSTMLEPNEKLSDNVYEFDSEGTIKQVDPYAMRKSIRETLEKLEECG